MKHLHLLLLLAGLGLAPAAAADNTLEYQVAEAGAVAKPQALVVKGGLVLAKGAGGGGNVDFIYTSSPENLFIIDHHKRSVAVLDEKQVDRLAKQADTVQPLVQGFAGQLAKLDPKQRAKWEEMLGGKVPLDKIAQSAKPTPPSKLVKTGKTRTVADIPCEQVNVLQGKAQTAELCLAAPDKLKLSEADYATLRSLFAFAERLSAKTQGLAKQFGVELPPLALGGLAGVPVAMREISANGRSLTLIRTSADEVPAEWMQVPKDYPLEPFKLWQ